MNEPDTTSSETREDDTRAREDAVEAAEQVAEEAFGPEASGVMEASTPEELTDEFALAGTGEALGAEPEEVSDDEVAEVSDQEAESLDEDSPERRIEHLLDQLDAPSQAAERAALLREVANIYEQHLDEPEHGFIALVQSLAEDPGSEEAYEGAQRLATSQEQWLEAVTSLNESLQSLSEQPAAAAELYVLLGRIYQHQLNRTDLATPCFAQALTLQPAHRAALEASTAIYRDTHAWEALVANLLHATSLTTDQGELATLQLETAQTLFRKLGEPGRAAPVYLQILQEDPEHREASEDLAVLYRAAGAHHELADLLQERALFAEGDELGDLRLELGRLFAGPLEDPERGLECFEAAVQASPVHAEALEQLSSVLSERGEVRKLLDVLDTRIKLAELPREQCDLHAMRAELYEEQVGDFDLAAECYRRVIDLDPGRVEAYESLARIYRRSQSFEELAEVLDHHAKSLSDDGEKAELLLTCARVVIGDLADTARARTLVDRVLGLVPDHQDALRLAARLRIATGDGEAAVEALDVLADTESDAARRAERLVETASLLEEREDAEGAIDRYRAALEAQPSMPQAVRALRRLYAEREQHAELLELLETEAADSVDAEQRSSLLLQAAELRRLHLNESTQAAEVYRASLELDPENPAAALALGDIAFDDGDWDQALVYLQPLLDKTARLKPVDALRTALRAGMAARQLGKADVAERAFLKALSMDATEQAALTALAELAVAAGRGADAEQRYRALLEAHRGDMEIADVSATLLKLGEALELADKFAEAAEAFEEAAELTPAEMTPLEALCRSQRAIEEWDALLKTLRRRLGALEGDARATVFEEMGQVLADRLDKPDKAVECYESALELTPDSRNVLARLMALYSTLEDWGRLTDTLEKLASLGGDEQVRGKYLYTAAAMVGEHLGDHARAADLYARTLALVPDHPRAADNRLDALRAAEDWRTLCGELEAKAALLDEDAPASERAALFSEIADLKLHRLEQTDAGRAALETAEAAEHDPARNLLLLKLYRDAPSKHAEALIQVCRLALEHNPGEADAFRALRALYTELEQPDAVWCVCQALRSLGLANEEETAFFRRHRTLHAAEAQACIEGDAWGHMLRHADEDPLLTSIFAAVAPAAVALHARPPAEVGLTAEQLVDPTTDPRLLARMLHFAAGVTTLPLPHIYSMPEQDAGVSYLPTLPPTLGMGRGASQEAPDQAVAFLAARQIAFLQNGYFMRQLEPTGRGLRAWLLAAIKRSMAAFPVPGELADAVNRNGAAIEEHLSDEERSHLDTLVKQLLEAAPELDMKRWGRAVDAAADRLGFVLANNLAACVAVIEATGDAQSVMSKQERLTQLHTYAVSPQYLAIRRHLGLSLD